jgi:hypothetical protein
MKQKDSQSLIPLAYQKRSISVVEQEEVRAVQTLHPQEEKELVDVMVKVQYSNELAEEQMMDQQVAHSLNQMQLQSI